MVTLASVSIILLSLFTVIALVVVKCALCSIPSRAALHCTRGIFFQCQCRRQMRHDC